MKSTVKKGFRRFPFIRKITRFVLQIRPSWRAISLTYEQEALDEDLLCERQRTIDEYIASHTIRKLQIGAGTNPLPGWLNTDLEPTTKDVLLLDATEQLPFGDAIFDYVFSEHMIEHINYQDGLFMMKEVFRVLKPDGKIRIATPDVKKIFGLFSMNKTEEQKEYIQTVVTENMGLYSSQRSELQQRRPEWDINCEHIRKYYPNIAEDGVCFIVNQFFRGFGHKYLYDENSMLALMLEAGFTNIQRYHPGASDDANLQGIESHGELIGEKLNDFETMVFEGDRK
jgi:SAM-dependent methyltransferase